MTLFHENITFQDIDLTKPLNFLFPVEGGEKGKSSRSKFDAIIDQSALTNVTVCS